MKTSADIYSISPYFDPTIDVNLPYPKDFVKHNDRRPQEQDSEIPLIFEGQIDNGKLIQKFLPKQANIDKPLKQNNIKYLDSFIYSQVKRCTFCIHV